MTLKNRLYKKRPPFRDAKLFVIICEGERREPDYFEFFDQITSKIKILPIPSSEGKSSPKHLHENAKNAVNKFDINDDDELWFVLDIDSWEINQIHDLKKECDDIKYWNIALSNPCFEVWLYYHFEKIVPELVDSSKCKEWKELIQKTNLKGFDPDIHPKFIGLAIKNSKINYKEKGYLPEIGSTQVFNLAEKIFPLIKDVLENPFTL